MSQTIPFARLGLAAMLGMLCSSAALAQTALSTEALNQLSPQARQTYLSQLSERQQIRPAQGGALDTTPPVLTVFNAGTGLNLGKAAAPFKINIKGTDDLSGIKSVGYSATGPSGQVISGAIDTSFPYTNFSGLGGFAGASQFLQPGSWKITSAFAFDWAGNLLNLDETALAALGNTSFTVSNSGGYDLVAPVLTKGQLVTPSVVLSKVAKGTASEDPSVGVKVTVSDTGNSALAGVQSASAIFCQLSNPGQCIYPSGATTATGVATVSLTLKSQVSAARGNVPGDYTLQSVTVIDYAGNFDTLTSMLFGGATDFSTLFTATTITLKP